VAALLRAAVPYEIHGPGGLRLAPRLSRFHVEHGDAFDVQIVDYH